MGAKAMQYLTSGHVVNPSLGTRSRRPVAHGPEVRYCTPSAIREITYHWFQMDVAGQDQSQIITLAFILNDTLTLCLL